MRSLTLCIFVLLILAASSFAQVGWQRLDDGLDLGYFKAQDVETVGDSIITVLRIDPHQWELKLLSLTRTQEERGLTAREWCEQYHLTAAINAGMFNEDYRSHTGYMRCGSDINNPYRNNYQSLAAFAPVNGDSAAFRLFDLDVTPLDSIRNTYSCLLQNLRLIDRTRRNRWSPQTARWSEAALGEDGQGRVLFIFSRSPYTMYDLNQTLLSLPIDLVCAQHLEGGPEAQMYLNRERGAREWVGSYETGFTDDDLNTRACPVPNVIGVVKR